MKTVAVSLSIGSKPLQPQIDQILDVLNRCNVNGFVVLAGHQRLDPRGSSEAIKTAHLNPSKVKIVLAQSGTWSAAYLLGMENALQNGANFIISMDSDGAHNPQDLERFIKELDTHSSVLASRFIRGGADKYPLQRKLVSFIGTYLARFFLANYKLSDFTSGYEGVRAEVIAKIFKNYPIEKWVCVTHGPYHLQNTELRMAIIYAGYDIKEIPIVYGEGKKGGKFKLSFFWKVFTGFLLLIKQRKEMEKLLS